MENLFGDLCSGRKFSHDLKMYSALNSQHQISDVKKRGSQNNSDSDGEDTESVRFAVSPQCSLNDSQSFQTASQSSHWQDGPVTNTDDKSVEVENDVAEDDTSVQTTFSTIDSEFPGMQNHVGGESSFRKENRKQIRKEVKRMIDRGQGIDLSLISTGDGHTDKEVEI